eukprot:TRINITY_DN22907_c0_g1_i1.p1 TRINITY_DN22907_c0_g1~~TRINITY_DN22907_c0_g1_i1.p1  ORF type:complete len:430 (+),score=53.26 TRINITY_DN22907_c0_g1_i1:68-1291(+)
MPQSISKRRKYSHGTNFKEWAMMVDNKTAQSVLGTAPEANMVKDESPSNAVTPSTISKWIGDPLGEPIFIRSSQDTRRSIICGICKTKILTHSDWTAHKKTKAHNTNASEISSGSSFEIEDLLSFAYLPPSTTPSPPPSEPRKKVTLLSGFGHLENPKIVVPYNTKPLRSSDMAPPSSSSSTWKPPYIRFQVNMDEDDGIEEVIMTTTKPKSSDLTPEQRHVAQIGYRKLLVSESAAYQATMGVDLTGCDHVLIVSMGLEHGSFFKYLDRYESTGKICIPPRVGVLAISPAQDPRQHFGPNSMTRLLFHKRLSICVPTQLTGKNPVENFMQIKALQIDKLLPPHAGITVVGGPTIHTNMAQLVSLMAEKGRSLMVMDCPSNNQELFFKLHSRVANRSSNRLYSVANK